MPNNREFIEAPGNIQKQVTNLEERSAQPTSDHHSLNTNCSSNNHCLRSDAVLIAFEQNDSTPISFEAPTNKSTNNNNHNNNNSDNNNTNSNNNGNNNNNKNRNRRLKASSYRTFVRLLRKQFFSLATSTPDHHHRHHHHHDHNHNTVTTINSSVAPPSPQIAASNGFCSSQQFHRHHQLTAGAAEVIQLDESTNNWQKSLKETHKKLFEEKICRQETHFKIGDSIDCQPSLSSSTTSETAMAIQTNNHLCISTQFTTSEQFSSGQDCNEKRSPCAVLSSSSHEKCNNASERQYDSNNVEANNIHLGVQQRFSKEKDHQLRTITATSSGEFDEAAARSSQPSSTSPSQAERASHEQQQAACTSADLQSTSTSINNRRVQVTVKAAAKLVQQLLPAAVYDDPFCAVTVDGVLHISEYYLMSNNRSKRRLSNYDRFSSKSIQLFDILTVFYANSSSLPSQNTESTTSLLYRAWGLTPINSVWWAADSTRTAGNRSADVSKVSSSCSSLVVLRCVERHPLQHGFTVVNLNAFINALRVCGLPESCSFVAHLPNVASNEQIGDDRQEQMLKYIDDVVVDVEKTQQPTPNST